MTTSPVGELRIDALTVSFRLADGRALEVLHDLELAIHPGEAVGLAGRSGSGKSVLCLAILGLLPEGAEVTAGRVLWGGADLRARSESEWRGIRGRQIAMIFQNPQSCLNPARTVQAQLGSVLRLHRGTARSEVRGVAETLLDQVHIPSPARVLAALPSELSGGMCQRVMIAMALACQPKLLLADEPTSALDVTTQAEILRLLREVGERHGMGILHVSHDLRAHCTRLAVLARGRIVEHGDPATLRRSPAAEETRALIEAAGLGMAG